MRLMRVCWMGCFNTQRTMPGVIVFKAQNTNGLNSAPQIKLAAMDKTGNSTQ